MSGEASEREFFANTNVADATNASEHKPGCVCSACEANNDRDRIDALEAYVRQFDALVIHLGHAETGLFNGLAFGGDNVNRRSLRAALDQLRVKRRSPDVLNGKDVEAR